MKKHFITLILLLSLITSTLSGCVNSSKYDGYPSLEFDEDGNPIYNGNVYFISLDSNYELLNTVPIAKQPGFLGLGTRLSEGAGLEDFGEIVFIKGYSTTVAGSDIYIKEGFNLPARDDDEIENISFRYGVDGNRIQKHFDESVQLDDMIDFEKSFNFKGEWSHQYCYAEITFKNYREFMLSHMALYEYNNDIYIEYRDVIPENRKIDNVIYGDQFCMYKVREEYQQFFKDAINEYKTTYPENTGSN